MKRTLQRHRATQLPSPKTSTDVIEAYANSKIMEEFGIAIGKTVDDGVFYDTTYQGDSFAYCVFSSKRSIALMLDKIPVPDRHIYVDATFKVVPNAVFQQLLIVFVEHFKQVRNNLINNVANELKISD